MVNKKMIRQAQQLQKEMLRMQEDLENSSSEATVGGGVVRAVVSGKMRLQALEIDPDAISSDDVDILQDMVMAAVNEALEKANDVASSRMNSITGGMKIPGLM